jgi:dTDP-4-dehydrorhamnose reductase
LRVLLTGRKGQIGWELEHALPALGEIIATDRTNLNLESSEAVREVVREVKPQVIVNAAAYTAVDRAESDYELAMWVNGSAPEVLSQEALRLGALLVHYSTDYVFDGEASSAYIETDAPNPVNAYGRTKLEGEKRIVASGCRYLILRASWVYAPRGRNFFLTIAKKLQAGEDLRVVNDQYGVPTEAKFVADITVALLRDATEGIFHVVPSGSTTWYGFATEIAKRLGSNESIQPIASHEYPTPARRPRNSVLNNTKLVRRLGALPGWRPFLERCITQWTLQGAQPADQAWATRPQQRY